MSDAYWKAKIWGLLHDPAFKPLHNNTGRGGNSFWRELPVMQDWVDGGLNPEESGKKILEHIKLADYITSASDRGAIGSVSSSVNYNENGLEISHLLSGEKQIFKLKGDRHRELISDRKRVLDTKENNIFQAIPESIKDVYGIFNSNGSNSFSSIAGSTGLENDTITTFELPESSAPVANSLAFDTNENKKKNKVNKPQISLEEGFSSS